MRTKACRSCGVRKGEKEFPIVSHKRLSSCFSCTLDEIKTQRLTGREGAAPRFRVCRHCKRRKRIERFPARCTNSGIYYRSYSCGVCCDDGLEWKPSKMMKKAMGAKWLEEKDELEGKDPWLEKLAASIALDRAKESEE